MSTNINKNCHFGERHVGWKEKTPAAILKRCKWGLGSQKSYENYIMKSDMSFILVGRCMAVDREFASILLLCI